MALVHILYVEISIHSCISCRVDCNNIDFLRSAAFPSEKEIIPANSLVYIHESRINRTVEHISPHFQHVSVEGNKAMLCIVLLSLAVDSSDPIYDWHSFESRFSPVTEGFYKSVLH